MNTITVELDIDALPEELVAKIQRGVADSTLYSSEVLFGIAGMSIVSEGFSNASNFIPYAQFEQDIMDSTEAYKGERDAVMKEFITMGKHFKKVLKDKNK